MAALLAIMWHKFEAYYYRWQLARLQAKLERELGLR